MDDVRMVEITQKTDLPLDLSAHIRVLHLPLVYDLDGDISPCQFMPCDLISLISLPQSEYY